MNYDSSGGALTSGEDSEPKEIADNATQSASPPKPATPTKDVEPTETLNPAPLRPEDVTHNAVGQGNPTVAAQTSSAPPPPPKIPDPASPTAHPADVLDGKKSNALDALDTGDDEPMQTRRLAASDTEDSPAVGGAQPFTAIDTEDTAFTAQKPADPVQALLAMITLTETAQFCSSKVLTAWLRH